MKFQSSADLSIDLGLIRDALNDSKITHDEICNGPLLTASQFGQIDVIKLLVEEYGINISAQDHFALRKACEFRYTEMVLYILSDPNLDILTSANNPELSGVRNLRRRLKGSKCNN